MPRYIDIDDTVKTFEKLHGEESTLLNCYNADWIFSFLESQPTVDVREVRHGKWIEDKETGSLICSECCHFTDEIIGDMIEADEDISLALEIPPKTIIHRSMNPIYCSKCGAKMDGEREEEVENA